MLLLDLNKNTNMYLIDLVILNFSEPQLIDSLSLKRISTIQLILTNLLLKCLHNSQVLTWTLSKEKLSIKILKFLNGLDCSSSETSLPLPTLEFSYLLTSLSKQISLLKKLMNCSLVNIIFGMLTVWTSSGFLLQSPHSEFSILLWPLWSLLPKSEDNML